jgi:hypothetical protein
MGVQAPSHVDLVYVYLFAGIHGYDRVEMDAITNPFSPGTGAQRAHWMTAAATVGTAVRSLPIRRLSDLEG